jgi:hypothetical protein
MSATSIEPRHSTPENLQRELRIYSHSDLMYWWPVWAVGLVMALWTVLEDHHMAVVPAGTVAHGNTLVAPEGVTLQEPSVHVTRSPLPGVVFALTLLTVLLFVHLWLRGPWALFILVCVVAVLLLISWLEWWSPLVRWFRLLRVHINLGGYLVLAVPLLIAWVVTIFFLDRRTYLILSLSQVRIRDELGDEEKVFDAGAVAFEKKPYDFFRRLVGWGAGDMIVRVGGPAPRVLEFPNVVAVSRRLAAIEARLRTRDVE